MQLGYRRGCCHHRTTYTVEADQPLRIEGEVFTLEPGGSVDHDSTAVNVFATGITVVAVDGDIIHCWIGPGLDIVVTPAGGNRLWEGLLGNPNADPSDDLITRDGTILDESDNSGYTLSESWQISDEESLFDYADLAHPSKQLLLADVAVNAPTERGQQIDSRQKSIVGIGNNVVLLHEANFAVTVESFGIDRAAIASRWRRAFPDATLADLSVGPDGQAYVLSRSGVKDGTQMILSRLDSDTGAIIAEVTLDGERLVEGSASVVVDDDGRVFVVTTREVDTRAGYLFGVSPQGDTLVVDWQVEVDGTSTQGIRQIPRSLNIVGDNVVGWYYALSGIVAIDRSNGEFVWDFEPKGSIRGIDEIPRDSAGNAHLIRPDRRRPAPRTLRVRPTMHQFGLRPTLPPDETTFQPLQPVRVNSIPPSMSA